MIVFQAYYQSRVGYVLFVYDYGCCCQFTCTPITCYVLDGGETYEIAVSIRTEMDRSSTHKDDPVPSDEQHVHLPFDILENSQVNTGPKIEHTLLTLTDPWL